MYADRPARPPETYDFGDDIGAALVTAATVMENEKAVVLGVARQKDGAALLLKSPMNDAELADYKSNSDAYFGRLQPVQKDNKTPYEFFLSLIEIHKTWPREKLLEKMKCYSNFAEIENLPHDHLVAVYCEGVVAMVQTMAGKKS